MSALADLRKAAELSRDQLGEEVGCSGEYIRRLEAGKHTPTLAVAYKIAGVLGKTVEEIWPKDQFKTSDAPDSLTT